jgi:hypothetical protein
VTDKQGKPLAIVGSFKGAIGQTSVHPGTLISEAFRVNGAAHIWFSHNHPSGKAEFSSADRYLYNELRSRLRGTGIEPMGMFAQTFTRSSGDWVYTDGNDTFNGRASREDGKVSVPIVERIMVQQGRLDSSRSR